eukprot:3303137-Pyramimonas_sp.AAC.1
MPPYTSAHGCSARCSSLQQVEGHESSHGKPNLTFWGPSNPLNTFLSGQGSCLRASFHTRHSLRNRHRTRGEASDNPRGKILHIQKAVALLRLHILSSLSGHVAVGPLL